VPKFDVSVTFEVTSCLTVHAEDEIDAGHKVIANIHFDWIKHAAHDPKASINSMELQISREDVKVASEVVRISNDEVNEMQYALFCDVTKHVSY
jgi:hypothetical protein